MLSKLVGTKNCYFSSLLAMIFGLLWSMIFFPVAILLVDSVISIFMEFSTALHVMLKQALGDDYITLVREFLEFVAAIISLLIGMKFGFKGSKKRRAYYAEFTDGFADVKSSFVHHYESYGAIDFISAIIASIWLCLLNKYVTNVLAFLPSHYVAKYIFAQSGFLYFLFSAILLSAASVYGVYASQRRWCADLLYDLE